MATYTQGQSYSDLGGVANYNPWTGEKLAPGQSFTSPEGNTPNPANSINPKVAAANPPSPTTISNQNVINKIPDIVNTNKQLTDTGIKTDNQGNATYANGTTVLPSEEKAPPTTGTTATGGYIGDVYIPPGGSLPQDSNGNYVTLSDYSPTDQKIIDNITQLKAQADSATTSLLDSIHQQYANLINQQQTINQSQNNSISAALLRGGVTGQGSSSQFAPISSAGITAAEASYGIQQISNLQQKENAAIISAQQAGDTQDYQLMEKLNTEIASIRDAKQTAAKDLNDKIAAQNQKIADQQFQIQQATQTMINNLAQDAAKNGASPEIIQAITNAKTPQDAINAAGSSLQTMTGDFADYPQYKRDAITNGVTPLNATDWLVKKQAADAKQKANEAYGTAFATAKGKAAGEAASGAGSSGGTLPVTGLNGVTFQVPAAVAPYTKISPNGVKYVDASGLSAAEKGKIEKDAFNNGVNPVPVITDPSAALDVANISDATLKLQDMQKAFSDVNPLNAKDRDLYQAAAITMAKKLQTNPQAVGTDVYQDAALDILKAMSGTKGFRGGASMVEAVKATFPKATDTQDVVNQKIANMQSLMDDRLTSLVGKPNASDQAIIDSKNEENNLTTSLNSIKTSNPKIYTAASAMFTSIDPTTGQPYHAADILKAFPQLAKK